MWWLVGDGKTPLAHRKRTSNALQTHRKRTANAFQTQFKPTSKAPQTHLKPYQKPWLDSETHLHVIAWTKVQAFCTLRRPFDVKFHEKKDEIPPGACRPSKKLKKKQCRKSGLPKSWKKQCRQSGSNKVEKNNVEKVGLYMLIYFHLPSCTFIYFQIALHTFIYPHIHQNIEYKENEGQHETQKWS